MGNWKLDHDEQKNGWESMRWVSPFQRKFHDQSEKATEKNLRGRPSHLRLR